MLHRKEKPRTTGLVVFEAEPSETKRPISQWHLQVGREKLIKGGITELMKDSMIYNSDRLS